MPSFSSHFQNNRELYQALLARNDRAYEYLYRQLSGPFQSWITKNNGSDMDADDTLQKGLMHFLLNLETGKYQFQESAKITTVIFDYCKKIWQTELKSGRMKHRANLTESSDPADSVDIVQDLEREEIVNAVRGALHQLKEDCRRLVEWFYIDELPLREIAEKLTMKETSVKSKRYDCTEKLKGLYLQIAKRNGL